MTKRALRTRQPPAAPRAPNSRIASWAVGLAAIVVIAGAVLWWRGRPNVPRPDLAAADPELVSAIDAAEAEIRREPRSAAKWGELGLLLMTHSFWPEAERCFQAATSRDGSDWRWRYYLAASARWDSPERAIANLRVATNIDRDAATPRILLGELLASIGDSGEAQREFEAVLELDPSDARAHLGLARVLSEQSQWEQALAALDKASTHPSTRKAAAELKAQVLQRLNRPAAAQEAIAAAGVLPRDTPWPDDPLTKELEARHIGKQAALQRANELRDAGAIDQAQAVVQKAEERHVDLYWLVEGRLRMERGDSAGAETALREALQLDPGSVDVLFSLAQAQARQEKLSDAERALRALLAREPAYGPAWLELGRCLRKADPPRALDALRSAVRYMPRSAEAHAELAAVLSEKGQSEEAEKHRKLAEQLQPR
jgi:tetratricopeptide (TPR) repeat protein